VNLGRAAHVDPPMRILFRSLPAFGHVYPMLPLADAARAAGHRVVFSSAGEFVARLDALGFEVVPAGIPIEQSIARRFGPTYPPTTIDGRTNWPVLGELFGQAAVDTADDLVGMLPGIAPDVVVYEQTDLGAAVAAAAHGVPAVSLSITRAFPPEVHEPFVAAPARMLHARYGLDGTLDVAEPEVIVDTYPPSLQLPEVAGDRRRLSMRPIPVSEPGAAFPDWIASRTGQLVYVTVGTISGYFGTLETIVDGLTQLTELDVDVLVTTGATQPEGFDALSPRVHVERFVDYTRLLPHLDLIVHHGGCGTTTGAWISGVPQLVWPHGADQHANADAVASSGCGVGLDDPTAADVAATASTVLLDPAYKAAANAVRDEIAAMPSPSAVLGKVLRRVTSGRRRAA
jgi:UDP:flavonoid glycosyltransferase YjiC (YdhE family)